MALSSKEITIIVIEAIIALVTGILLDKLSLNIFSLRDSIVTIIIILIATSTIIMIVYKRFKEVNEEIHFIKVEQKKLNEKPKIYKRLSIIEQKIGIKNGEN